MEHKEHKKEDDFNTTAILLIAIAAVVILFNQIQLFQLSNSLGVTTPGLAFGGTSTTLKTFSNGDLSSVNIDELQSTAQVLAAVVPIDKIKTAQDALDIMVPRGQPEWATELGINYDDPVAALNFLHRKLYPAIKQDVKTNSPEVWERYINLATKPVGISCEYCCGVGPVTIDENGELLCGCSHAPAIQAVALYLMKNTDMTDVEILQEVIRWKTLWFPKNMVGLALQIAGGDTSVLEDVPGMVGGC